MLTTENAGYDAKFRLWRQHSMSVPDSVRHSANDVIFENYDEVGYNYRLTDVQAAIGREQLKKLPSMLTVRRALATRYHELLATIRSVRTPAQPDWARTNWQSYCVRLPRSCDQRS